MLDLVAQGWIALLAIGIILVELAVLRLKRWPRFGAVAANGLAGMALLAGLYAAQTGAGAGAIALALGVSFVAHIAALSMGG